LNPSDVVLRALETAGLLLMQDKSLPSVVALVAGEPIRGSWWAHPYSHEIFRRASEIVAHADVLLTKLMDGKVTLVHRRLWPELLAVATAREAWQTEGLSRDASKLLRQVEQEGGLVATGPAAKELERRLLVHGEQFHSESGNHKTKLESWKAWSERSGVAVSLRAETARTRLERAVTALGGRIESLPWRQSRSKPPRGPG
jgi:hypothetical protein